MFEIDKLLKEKKRIHFIGIGGSGMCPLAEILHTWGYEVSGSDNNTGDNIDKLRALGMKVILGQKAENIEGTEIIVYTAAILKDNPLDIVEVYCPLEICRERNIARGDRFENQSQEQFELMAENIKYSMRVDTSMMSSAECAEAMFPEFLLKEHIISQQ